MKDFNFQHLKRCHEIYEDVFSATKKFHETGNDRKTAALIQALACFAWTDHPGFYADDRVEQMLCDIGGRLEEAHVSRDVLRDPLLGQGINVNKPRKHILHVATCVYTTGGHTKWIENWMRMDNQNDHSLVLLSQTGCEYPKSLELMTRKRNGAFFMFPGEWMVFDKAFALRTLSKNGYDMVVLHHHPDDVVPVLAFAVKDVPPVAIANHADHVFWLGASVADLVINFRHCGQRLSELRRGVESSRILPLPFHEATVEAGRQNLSRPDEAAAQERNSARDSLGIPHDQIVLMSMASAYKYVPMGNQNFFRTALKILERNPKIHIYMIGVSREEYQKMSSFRQHERLHLLGVIVNPEKYQRAADIYLSSYPFGSLTALLESVLLGAAPVMAYDPESMMFMSEDPAFAGLLEYPEDEEAYVERVLALADSPDLRRGLCRRVQKSILEHHSGARWNIYLKEIYGFMEDKQHDLSRVSDGCMSMTNDDIVLNNFLRLSKRPSQILAFFRKLYRNISLKKFIQIVFKMLCFGFIPFNFVNIKKLGLMCWNSFIVFLRKEKNES